MKKISQKLTILVLKNILKRQKKVVMKIDLDQVKLKLENMKKIQKTDENNEENEEKIFKKKNRILSPNESLRSKKKTWYMKKKCSIDTLRINTGRSRFQIENKNKNFSKQISKKFINLNRDRKNSLLDYIKSNNCSNDTGLKTFIDMSLNNYSKGDKSKIEIKKMKKVKNSNKKIEENFSNKDIFRTFGQQLSPKIKSNKAGEKSFSDFENAKKIEKLLKK